MANLNSSFSQVTQTKIFAVQSACLPHPHPYPFTHPNLFENHLGLCDIAGGPVHAGGGREPPAAWSLWKTEDVGNCLTGETLEAGELPVSTR